MTDLRTLTDQIIADEEILRQGGGPKGVERQKRLNRLTVRERLHLLLDKNTSFFELGIWAGYQMYEKWGGASCCWRCLRHWDGGESPGHDYRK
jgi:3-methylcrotonyl-CoA carboxylase beta subunit